MSPNFRTCSKQIVHSIIVICMNTPISNDKKQIYVFGLFPSWEFWFLNITTIVNQSDQLTKYILYFMSLGFCRQTYTCYSFLWKIITSKPDMVQRCTKTCNFISLVIQLYPKWCMWWTRSITDHVQVTKCTNFTVKDI
jgi:hypothetical protein